MINALLVLLALLAVLLVYWTISRLMSAAAERKMLIDYVEKNKDLDSVNRALRKEHESTYRGVARRVHDDIGAEASSAKLMLGSLARNMEGEDFALYLSINDSLNRIIDQARMISRDLYPACLQTAGLDAALHELCERLHAPKWMAVQYVSTGQHRRLLLEHEEVLYRSVRELLINSQKHAHAWKVNVTSTWLDHELQIDVMDDGQGLQPSLLNKRGLGHRLIAGTLEMIQAKFQIHESPKGFHATIRYTDHEN